MNEGLKPLYVLQDWLGYIPIRMQSTLILGLRGPDTHHAPKIKEIARWLRGHAFKPGNPENMREFMHHELPDLLEKNDLAKELEFCTQHYYSHLMHAVEVIGYRHPNTRVAVEALRLFHQMCAAFHLTVESKQDFEERLKQIEWLDGQPDSYVDACNHKYL